MHTLKSLLIALGCFLILPACSQTEEMKTDHNQKEDASKYAEAHKYGGWFCPDNLGGFPPVDINELDLVPVVKDRLPTREEASNGSSLMYFDTSQFVNVKPLDMDLPRLGSVYSRHNDMNELVIVIQAVVIGEDTVVGYRFPHGGNGSAWLKHVTFLSDKEVNDMGSNPFVYQQIDIDGMTEDIWDGITQTEYAKKLGQRFDQKSFFESEWTAESRAHLSFEEGKERGSGYVSIHFGNFYLHIDYELDGFHYSEKLLIIEDEENESSTLHLVAGPYPKDFETQQRHWGEWLEEVKGKSEE